MHSFVTIVVPFSAFRTPAVEQLLDQIGNPAGPGIKDPLDSAEFVHFLSITVVEGNTQTRPHLVIELSADGGLTEIFERIAATIGQSLRDIFDAALVMTGSYTLAQFLQRHHVALGQGWFSATGVTFDGTPGMSVTRIKKEATLAAKTATFIETLSSSDTALARLTKVRRWLWTDEKMKWAFVPEPAPLLGSAPSLRSAILPVAASAVTTLLWPFILAAVIAFVAALWTGGFASGVCLAVLFAAAALLVPPRWPFAAAAALSLTLGLFAGAFVTALWAAVALLAAAFGAAYALLIDKEAKDVPDDLPPSPALVESIMRRENFGAQNHMAATSTIKPGALRRLSLRLGLWVAGQLAAHFSAPGSLGQIGAIHFARWLVLPGTNQLLFRSNFDGTWEEYLEEFIALAYQGVNGIWSNTIGFPRTRNLFNGGAQDGDRLRRWTRRQQHPTRVWYSAYPQLTLTRIRINAAIRQGITSAVTEADAADWMACFGSAPRPVGLIEAPDIPTLVFGGLRRLYCGACLLIRMEQKNAKQWLGEIEPNLSFGDQAAARSAMLVGMSCTGLMKLGIEQGDIETFPVAFQDGSAAPWRAQALSDIGRNAPENWLWGRPDNAVDAVLLVYARDEAALEAIVLQRTAQLTAGGHHLIREIRFDPLPTARDQPVREPFGFIDGISDPVIRGVGQWMLPENGQHISAPGEFVLGYSDNLGFIPSSPSVAATKDPTDMLPALATTVPEPRPSFSARQPTARKDLGRNGTFLVVRHLQQDKDAFEQFLEETATSLIAGDWAPSHDPKLVAEWIAAKLVGRWRTDGSSLVRYPHRPRTHTAGQATLPKGDNQFLYSVEDPTGLRCPFGAHIRRANPRESFAQPVPVSSAMLQEPQAGVNPFETLSPAAQEQLAITNRHRILRVGRGYRAQGDLSKPGLIFMCLNTDIERQFEFIQKTWLGGSSFHGLESEQDPLIGQDTGSKIMLTIPTTEGPVRLKRMHEFVTLIGSGYFFLPGRKAVQFLAK